MNSFYFSISNIITRKSIAISMLVLLIFASVGSSYGQVASITFGQYNLSTVTGFTNYYKRCFTSTSTNTQIPVAYFDLPVTLNSTGTNSSSIHTIDWGDGSAQSVLVGVNPTMPTHSYPYNSATNGGTFILTYTVSNGSNPNTITRNLYLGCSPTVNIDPQALSFCAPLTQGFNITQNFSNPYLQDVNSPLTNYTIQIYDAPLGSSNPPPISFLQGSILNFQYNFSVSSCLDQYTSGLNSYPNANAISATASNPCGSTNLLQGPIYVSQKAKALYNTVIDNVTYTSLQTLPSVCVDKQIVINDMSDYGQIVDGTSCDLGFSDKRQWIITPNTGYTVTGTLGTSVSSANSTQISLTFTQAGTYTIKLIVDNDDDVSCDPDELVKTIVIDPLPSASITPSLNICQNSTSPNVVFTGSNGTPPYTFTYTVNNGANQTITTTSGNSISVAIPTNILTNYIYNLISVEDSKTCVKNINQIETYTINPAPTVTINDPAICSGQSTTLTATPSLSGGSFLWSNSSTSQSITVTPPPTTYTVTYTSVNGCSVQATRNINILQTPSVIASLNTNNICSGSSTTIQALGNPVGGIYSWTGANNFSSTLQSPSISPTSNSIYTVSYSLNGCPTSDTVNVFVKPLPQVSVNNPAICLGSPAAITSFVNPSGGTYSWNPGPISTAGFSVTPNATGVLSYILSYQAPNGCFNYDTAVVTTSITASVALVSDTICSGQSATLNATITNGAATNGIYAWSPGNATTPSITVTPGATTNYSVTYTLGGCPSTTTSATVTVNPTPNVTATGTAICPGASATVSSIVTPTGGSYLWSNNLNTSSISVSPSTSTTYSLTYTTLNGCTGTDTANVIIKPIATVTVNSDTICNGQSALLTATPNITGGTYLWSPGGATTQSITVSPTTTTTYSVQYILNGCSSALESGVVTVNPLPTLTINSNGGTTICAGQVLTLTGNPNLPNGSFAWSPGGQTTSSITINPQTTTNYSLVYTLNSCSVTAQLPITVNPIPSVNTTNTTICAGQAASLSSTVSPSGGSYSWTSGATTSGITVNVSSTSTYILSYTVNGCTYSDTSLVTVIPTPVVTINPLTSTVCSGVSQVLNAVVVGYPTTGSYQWNTGASISSITVTPSSTQNYSVIYTLNGCPSNSVSATVTVNPSPTATAIGATICPGATASLTSNVSPSGGTYLWTPGNQTTSSLNVTPSSATIYTLTYTLNNCSVTDTANVIIKPIASVVVNSVSICNGQSALLTATPTITGGTYLWSPGGATTQSITVSPSSTTTYSLQYTLNACSSALAFGNITVKPVPVASIVPNIANPVCAGQVITLTGGANLPNGTYTWTAGGQTTQAINVNPQTTNAYSMVYNLNGCVDTVQYTVNVNPKPLITVNDASICAGSSTTLTATGTPLGGTYSWTGGATTNSITVSPAATSTYIVTYTQNGCSSSDTALVQVTNTPTISLTPVNPTICSGSSVLLTATPINSPLTGSYQWNTGATTQSITVSPVIQTTYSVTYVLNGCPSLTQSTTVNVNPSPSVNIDGISVCPGSSVTLASNVLPSGGTYSWSNNQTPATSSSSSLTVMPGVTTIYTLSYSLNNCTATDTAIVTVKPVPTLTVNYMTICQGQNALLTATPNLSGGTFVWTPNGASTPSITVSPSSTTNYSVIYTLAGCSSLNTTGTVTVNPYPIATITTNAIPPICSGQSVNLTANINGQYAWSPGSQTSQSITVNPLATTTYTLINTLNGCSDTASYTVVVTPNPTISIVSDTICIGQTASLLAVGLPSGGTYLWTPVNLTTAGITVAPISTSNYTVNYSLNGCSSATTSSVLVHPLPNVSAGPDITVCTGTSITLSGSGAQSYSWNNNVINNQGFVPLTNGNYIVTGTDIFGCVNTDQVDVTINSYPSVSVNNTTICSGLAASLVASASPSGGTYLWTPNSATTSAISVTPIVNSSYIVAYTLNNCTSTDTSYVTVITSPTLSVNSDTICNGQSSILTAIPSIPGGVYAWSSNETTNAITVAPTTTSSYTVSYNVNGCQSPTQTSVVTVNPVPVITAITAPVICSGQNATLTATVNITGGTYVWSNGQTGQTISVAPNVNTSYSLIYTLNGCSSASFSTNVTVNQSPTINAGSDQLLCAGQSTTLNPTVSGLGGTFLWSPSTGLNNALIQSPTVTLSSSQNYTVVYTLNGCPSAPDTVVVNVIQNPVASVNNATVCNGTPFTLIASPANASYTWSTGETTSSISPISPIGTTNYTVTVVIPGCPTSTATSVVIVNPIPTITVGADQTACNGQTAVLTSTPSAVGGTYLWSPSGQTTQSLSLAPSLTSPLVAQNFTQTLVYTLNNCSSVADTGIIHVNPIPTASVPNQTICNQGTAILTPVVAPSGGTYAWSPSGQTTTQNIVNPTATTTYSLVYTLNGCNSLPASSTVTVNPNPTITVNSQIICDGQLATLTATPNQTGGSYSWLPGGQVSQSITVAPNTTISYSCIYTLNGCSSDTISGMVTVKPVPTLSLSDTTICGGYPVNLTALTNIPNGTFSWSPGGQNTQGISVSPSTTTVYTVNYTAPNGCAAIPDQGTVTVIQNPVATLNGATICNGQSTTLNALPNGANYSWSPGGATTQSLLVSPTTTTNYTVTVSIGGCASTNATATVTVNPIPSISIGVNDTICNGQTAVLTSTPSAVGGTYLWSPSGQTTQSLSLAPSLTSPLVAQNFTQTLVYTLNNCSSVADTGVIHVNPIPTASVPNQTICNQGTAILTPVVAPAGGTYAWSPSGQTTTQNIVNPTATTTYSLIYTLNGCNSLPAASTVTVNPNPSITVNSQTICNGQSAILTATPNQTGGSYSWLPGGQVSQSITVAPNTTSSYSCVYTLNGCPSASVSGAVTVKPVPTLSLSDTTICGGYSVNLTALTNIPSGTFTWIPGGQNTQGISVAPATTTVYTVNYTAPNGCAAIPDQGTVTVIQNPVATLNGATICNGQSTTLNAFPNGANYLWSPGGATTQNLLVSPNTTTNYTVTVSIGGCPSTNATASVAVNPVPLVSINTPNPICNGSSTSLTASPNLPNGTFIWSPAGQTTNTININPTVNTPYSVIYTLNNCSSIPDTVIVVVNPVPIVSFNDTTICFGQNATLSSIVNLPNGTYLWSTGETTSQINVVPSVTTIYTLQYTLNGCTGSFTDTVFVNSIPNVTPQANQTVCYGTQACINALVTPSGGTFQWSGLGVIPPANNSAQLCVTPLTGNSNVNDTIPYQIIYTVNGCSDTASTNIIVKLIPTVSAWANFDTICPGNSSELYSIGLPGISNGQTGTYAWTPSATLSVSVGDTVTATPLSTTTYNVIYTLNGCPSAPASVVITIASAPQVAIVNNPTGSICIGGCVVLSAVPSATLVIPSGYVWNTGATTQSITVCPLDTTNYSVIGTLGNCASPLATTVINVVADPIINTQPIIDTVICEGGTYPLSFGVSGGLGTPNYQWYSNSTSSTIGAVPIPGATSSNYLPPVFAADANYFYFCQVVYPVQGCNTLISDMAEIEVINDPIVTVAPNGTQIMCVGGTVDCLVPTVTGGIGTNNYSWFQFTPTSITSVSSTQVFCPETDSVGNFVYGVVVSQSGIGCVSSTSSFNTIQIVPDPILTISTTDVICNGGSVSIYSYLDPNFPGLGATAYQWQQAAPPGSGFVNIPGETNDNYISPELYGSVDYQLIVTQAGNGCNAVSNVEPVLVVPDPVMQLSYDPFGCVGTYNQIDVNILGGTGSYVLSWFSNDTSLNTGGNLVGVENDLSFTTTGFFAEETYYYYAQLSMSGIGCDADTSAVATIQSMNWANASFDVDSYQNSILNPTFSFTNTSTNATAYAWDLGECAASSVSLFATPTPYYNVGSFNQLNYTYGCEPGNYTVTLIANNQGYCPDTAMAVIQIYDDLLLYVPNSFTPNGDLMNDVFHPVITSGIRPKTYSFTVFNRWGEVVYQTNDPTDGWNGFKNNKLCQDGTYTWLIKFFHSQNGEAKEFVGHINLLK